MVAKPVLLQWMPRKRKVKTVILKSPQILMTTPTKNLVIISINKRKTTKSKIRAQPRIIRGKYTLRLQSRSQRNTLIVMRKETLLLRTTKWSTRLRCAEIGRNLGNASSRTLVHLLMDLRNWTRRNISHLIIKQRFASSSILPATVPMVIDVSFCIPNMISIARSTRLSSPL